MSKVSLDQQIEEVRREIKYRGEVYPRLVTQGKMRQSIADFHVFRMEAVEATLMWLRDNEPRIRAALKKEDPGEAKAAAQA